MNENQLRYSLYTVHHETLKSGHIIERGIGCLPFLDQATFIEGPDEGLAHVILANLNPSILHHPLGNSWVSSIDALCHVSFTCA